MTEIPEHLLKRSRERRAALGLGGDARRGVPGRRRRRDPAGRPGPGGRRGQPGLDPRPGGRGGQGPAAPRSALRPGRQAPEEGADLGRPPRWSLLPLWGYVYVRTLEPPPAGADDPLVLGTTVYATNCASCHGGTGGGVSAPQLSDGKVLETWPDWRDHAAWVRLGTAGWPAATYGAQGKPVGGGGTMPSWDTLTDQQIAEVVLHERGLSGEDVSETNSDNEDIYAVARGEKTLADVGLGPLSKEAGVTEADLGG